MPANEVLEYYGYKGVIGILKYGFKFVFRFILNILNCWRIGL